MRTSYSALETYKTCPLKYKYSQIDKIRGDKSKEMVFGSTVHKSLHFMFKRNPLFPTLDEVIEFFSTTWTSGASELEIPEDQKTFYLDEGRAILKKFFLKNQPWNFNILDLESRFEVLLEDLKSGRSHILAGIIDRVDKPADDSYEIIDYKTSRRMPSQDMVDKDLQLSIYNLGLLKRWPHIKPDKIKLSLYFMAHEEKISSARNEAQLLETKDRILGTIREIEAREGKMDFPPTPGGWCEFCPYRQICPMWRHLYKKPETPSDEEIKSVIKEYFSLKSGIEAKNDRVKLLQQKIHQYLDEKGLERVFGADGYVTRRIAEKKSYDLERAREILEPLGLWQEILKADEKKLEKIFVKLPEDAQKKIDALSAIKKVITLTASRKKIDENEEESDS